MEPVTTINVAAMLVLLGGIIAKVVQRLRRRFPRIDGDLVSLLAIGLGVGLAWSLDLRGAGELASSAGMDLGTIPAWLDYALTGIGLGLGAGVINDLITKTPSITVVNGNLEELPHEAAELYGPELPDDELGAH